MCAATGPEWDDVVEVVDFCKATLLEAGLTPTEDERGRFVRITLEETDESRPVP